MSQTKSEKKSGGLAPRLATAVVAVPLLIWVLFWSTADAWFVVVLAAAAIGLVEYFGMTTGEDDVVVGAMGTAVGTLLLPVVYFFFDEPLIVLGAFTAAALALFLTVLFSFSNIERAGYLIGVALGGLLYVPLLMSSLALLRREPGPDGAYWILLILAITWAGDTGAYFAGKSLGKHKLSQVVSPKKTWEGAIGGALASTIAAFVVVSLSPLDLPALWIVALALPAAVLGQLGDLCESLLKRSGGVKDSGRVIYGHGGILDRVDALIFAGPYAYFFYEFTSGSLI